MDVERYRSFATLARKVVERFTQQVDERTQRYLGSLSKGGEWGLAVAGLAAAIKAQGIPITQMDYADFEALFAYLEPERHQLDGLSAQVVEPY